MPRGHLPTLINAIRPSVEAALGQRHGAPSVEAVIRTHVSRSVAELRANQPILAAQVRNGQLEVAGGVYDIASGSVTLI